MLPLRWGIPLHRWELAVQGMPALLPCPGGGREGNTGGGSDMQQGGSEATSPQDEFKCQNHNNNNN